MNRILSALCFVGLSIAASAAVADDTFLGALALLDDAAVVEQLGLSAETQSKVKALIDEREDASLELTLTIKDLPVADRDARLAEFRSESEKLGLALLTPAQQTKLQAAKVNQAGVQALIQPEIIEQLHLSALQQTYVKRLLEELQASAGQGTEAEQRAAKARIERSIVETLKPDQLAIWDRLTGRLAGPADAAATETAESSPMPESANGDTAGETTPPVKDPSATRPSITGRPTSPAATAGARRPSADGKVKFQFRYAPWKDVLEWFAEQADLSLVLDAPPQGTFNYSDSRSYTPGEAIDLLNGVLLTKGYTLVRRERMLMVVNLEDGFPPDLLAPTDLKDLDSKGNFELARVQFQLNKWAPEEAEAEVRKMIGPQGSVTVLAKAKQLMVTETGGKLRAIQKMLEAVENPTVPKDEKVSVVELKYVTPNGFLTVARPLIGLPEGVNATPDGTLRLSIDDVGNRLLATGKAERLTQLQDIVKLIDVPGPGGDELDAAPIEQPQLEVYRVTAADPASVLQIMQTLLAGLPDVRLTTDPKTGNLVALAKPSQHATIRATLEQLQRDASQVEVIKLRKLDPQAAVLAINKIFGGTAEGAASPNGPKVDADPSTNNLLLRGNAAQIAQVKELLNKMGESGDGEAFEAGPRSKMRVLPLSGRTMESALTQLEAVWPTLHANKIRVIKPSSSGNGIKTRGVPRDTETRASRDGREKFDDNTDDLLNDLYPPIGGGRPARRDPSDAAPQPSTSAPTAPRSAAGAADKSTRNVSASVYFVAQIDAAADSVSNPGPSLAPSPQPSSDGAKPAPAVADQAATIDAEPKDAEDKEHSVPGAEVVVTVTPNGLIITSEDLDALDEFEEMLRTVTEGAATSGGREYTVFYLKYAKAEIAATLLTEAIGGGGASGGDEGGGSLMGDLASSMLGDAGGGLLGGLLGGGGGGGAPAVPSSGVSIIPDPRLNALMVLAKTRDIEMIEQLLQVIDQPSSPESPQTIAPPRFIPVINSAADEIAVVVRQVYSGRIAGEATQQRQPTPEDFVRALRGGGRGGRGSGGSQQNRGEEQKMTVGVDARTNSLIVSAPDYLFEEVKLLVAELDTAETNSDETVRVVTLKRANADLIQRSISSVLGPTVTTNRTAANTSNTQQSQNGRGGQGGQRQGANPAEQQMQFFNNLQRAMGQGGGRGGRGGGQGGQGGGNRGGGRTGR